jgi:hypothetical protein
MSPRLTAGATLVIDRHYNSLKPYRKGEFNMYAVLKNDTCALRYIELAGSHPILRPRNQSDAAEVIPIPESQTASGFLVGRISHVSQEL